VRQRCASAHESGTGRSAQLERGQAGTWRASWTAADLLAVWTWRWPGCPRRYYSTCMHRHHILHLGAWLPIIIVIAILIFAFEIWMIVDAAINREITDKAKAWWIIGMLIIHPFVAIAYFFTDHRKR
jgi:hypothetical protein